MVITSQGQTVKTDDKTVKQQDPHPATIEGGAEGPNIRRGHEDHPVLNPRYSRNEKGEILEGGKVVHYGRAQPMVMVFDKPLAILRDIVDLSPSAKMPTSAPADTTISIDSPPETMQTHLVPYRGGYIVSGPLADKLAQHRGLIVDQAIPGIEGMDLHPLREDEIKKREKAPGIVVPSRTYGGDLISEDEAKDLGDPSLVGLTKNVPIGDDPQNPSADVTPVPMANETDEQRAQRSERDKAELERAKKQNEAAMKASPPTGTSENPDKSEPSTKENKKS